MAWRSTRRFSRTAVNLISTQSATRCGSGLRSHGAPSASTEAYWPRSEHHSSQRGTARTAAITSLGRSRAPTGSARPSPMNRVFRVERVVRGQASAAFRRRRSCASRLDGLVVGIADSRARALPGYFAFAFRRSELLLSKRAAPGRRDDQTCWTPGPRRSEDGAVVVAVRRLDDDQPARPPRQHRFYPLREPLRVVGALEALRCGLRLPQLS